MTIIIVDRSNQEQADDYDFWTDSYASDDDEIPTKQVSQDIMEEESSKEILVSPHPRKTTPLVLSCQRDPEATTLSLINQDLLYLKKGKLGPEKIVLSLHKFPPVVFNDDDIKEQTSRWANKYVKKFNPYARYGVEHWKNPHAKIVYIRKQKDPGKPKEGEGSTVQVESHHIPIGAPSTSPPHFSSPPKSSIRQETKVSQPSSPTHTYIADEAASTEKTVKTSQARRIAKIVVSDEEVNLEDSSQQGRKIEEIDQDPDISLIQHDADIQGRHWYTSEEVQQREKIKAKAKRKKSMTQAEQRNHMSNYIKHMGSYTLKQLKKLSFDEIKEFFKATMRSIEDFVPMESEDDKAIPKLAKARSSKRDVEEDLDQGKSKKQ
nr:hypothetical protein [Tanacetum cinerariifolium]